MSPSELTDLTELMHRQVNSSHVRAGRPTQGVFKPRASDKGMLSVSRSSMRNAQESFEHFVRNPKCKSEGVLAVSVEECKTETLSVVSDPLSIEEHEVDDPAHACIDFTTQGEDEIEQRAMGLHRRAMDRGYCYRPNEKV